MVKTDTIICNIIGRLTHQTPTPTVAFPKVFNVTSADEMLDQCLKLFSQIDICIMNAAVSDYKPVKKFDKKWENKVHRTRELTEFVQII